MGLSPWRGRRGPNSGAIRGNRAARGGVDDARVVDGGFVAGSWHFDRFGVWGVEGGGGVGIVSNSWRRHLQGLCRFSMSRGAGRGLVMIEEGGEVERLRGIIAVL